MNVYKNSKNISKRNFDPIIICKKKKKNTKKFIFGRENTVEYLFKYNGTEKTTSFKKVFILFYLNYFDRNFNKPFYDFF